MPERKTMPSRKKVSANKLTALYISFWGPFGLCVHNDPSGNSGVEVHVPKLDEKTHQYVLGDTSNIDPVPPLSSGKLYPFPAGVNDAQLLGVDSTIYAASPDDKVMLLLDAEDVDVNIKYIGTTRNSLWFPLPSKILPNQLYFVNGIFDQKTAAAKRLNKRQSYLPNVVSLVYGISTGLPSFQLGTYKWTPPAGTTGAQIHFLIGPKTGEGFDDSPEDDFNSLARLFPDLDLAVTKFPDTIYAFYAKHFDDSKHVHPPYSCRAAAMGILNPPSPNTASSQRIRGSKGRVAGSKRKRLINRQ